MPLRCKRFPRSVRTTAGDTAKADGRSSQTRGGVLLLQKTGEGITEKTKGQQQRLTTGKAKESSLLGVSAYPEVTRRESIIASGERRRSTGENKKRVRFSISRMDCDTYFKVTMSIKKESDGVPVFFKVGSDTFNILK
ncbi:hypothetical protein SK128_014607 [Halocaridina rubra]|uniref:Uncharacterized protein n=1 Tax=Halocaridina rubra TaxID=373956 RepID=A0AAN8WS27_HALRR